MIAIGIWLASFVGAALFFAAGVFFNRASAAAVNAAVSVAVPETEHTHPHLHAHTAGNAGAHDAHEDDLELLDAARRQADEVKKQLDHERRIAHGERAKLEARVAQLQQAQDDAARQRAQLQRALDDALARQQHLEHEKRNAETRLAEQSAQPPEVTDVDYDAVVSTQLIAARGEEISRLHAENTQLRSSMNELESLRQRNAELSAELGERRVQELLRPPKAPSLVPRMSGSRLQNALDEAAAHARCASITDEQGLTVASRGEYAEELGAFGAFLFGVATRVQTHMPLGAVKQVSLEDNHQLRLTVQRFQSADAHLVLSTLTMANEPEPRVLHSLVEGAPKL